MAQAMDNNKKRREAIPLSSVNEQKQNVSAKKFVNPYPEITSANNAYIQFSGKNFPKSDGTTYMSRFLDNLYPYGYQDGPGPATLETFISKIGHGIIEKSDRKKYLDKIIDLDLNDPKQLKEAESYRQYFDNFKYSSIQDIQQSARLREDLNRLYSGIQQKYNSFMINPDYSSITAKSKGQPTYIFTDPKLRKQYQQAGLAFNKSHDLGVHPTNDNQKNVFNRFSTVKMHPDGSGRYLEEWDFVGVGNPVYVGDTIPANVGKGKPFKYSTDNTPTNFYDFIKYLIKK